jgi:NADH pyrophosphatase NudC (nudix superfamily)
MAQHPAGGHIGDAEVGVTRTCPTVHAERRPRVAPCVIIPLFIDGSYLTSARNGRTELQGARRGLGRRPQRKSPAVQ